MITIDINGVNYTSIGHIRRQSRWNRVPMRHLMIIHKTGSYFSNLANQ